MGPGLASAGEMGLFFTAALVLFRRLGLTLAESGAYSVTCLFMAFSFLFQAAFLTGLPSICPVIEAVLSAGALGAVVRHREILFGIFKSIRENIRNQPVAAAVLGGACAYLIVRAFFVKADLWPDAMAAWKGAGGLGSGNAQVLAYLFFRWPTGTGAGLVGFAAYLGIGFATYALARRYAWSPTASCVTVVVLSFPRFVYHAVLPRTELVPAAVGVFCILATYRLVEQLKAMDLVLLVLAVLFQISPHPMGVVFPLILAALAFKVSYHRHGMFSWRTLVKKNQKGVLLGLFPAVVFSQAWRVVLGSAGGAGWVEHLKGAAFNPDGIYGAAANLIRYLLQAFQFPGPVEDLLFKATGIGWSAMLMRAHDFLMRVLSGPRAGSTAFVLPRTPGSATAGFGPMGLLLLWPAVFYALFRGPRRLKAVSIALLAYVYAVVLILAWQPENGACFNVFYAAAGFCMAFLLPPWRLTLKGKRTILVLGALVLAVTCYQI